jgi:hypothetical protein
MGKREGKRQLGRPRFEFSQHNCNKIYQYKITHVCALGKELFDVDGHEHKKNPLLYSHGSTQCFGISSNYTASKVGPCHHGMARPQVADGGTASDMKGSCE